MNQNNPFILPTLKAIEAKEQIQILYAIESGSRAWGFASSDSDYDVRFIYLRSQDWYLSINPKRDVLEFPLKNNLDINGWDLTKALLLFRKSNPPLLEWLHSSTVYIKPHPVIIKLKKLQKLFFSPQTCFLHYLAIAHHSRQDILKKEEIKLKKYFYILRPLFACEWIKQFQSVPPIEFVKLMEIQDLSSALINKINQLLEDKKAGQEQDLNPKIKIIDDFVEQRIKQFQLMAKQLPKPNQLPYEPLNELFQEVLGTVS